MPRFIPYDYGQSSMVVVNFQDQLQAGTFEHAVHYLVDNKLDLSIFDGCFSNDDGGRPAYDPAILLKITLFAYSKGITSSREIEWCCKYNIIFKALSCDTVPHFTTIANFISAYPKQVEQLFEQVLLVCHEQGLLGNELFAIDGCKLPSNAAKTWSGTHQELKAKRTKLKRLIRRHMAEHRKLDQQESFEAEQAKRIEQSIETLSHAADKIDLFLKDNEPRIGKGKRKAEVKSNITDNDSAKMTTSKGTIQGYNGVATVDKKHQVVVDAQAFGDGQEHHTLKPVTQAVKNRFQRLKISDDIYASGTIVTADTGFANEVNMQYLHEQGIDAYVPDKHFRSRDPKFASQKEKYPRPSNAKPENKALFSASEFKFDPVKMVCICPAGEPLSFRMRMTDKANNHKAYFEGRLLQCRNCKLKARCMKNPSAADHRKGSGRHVSFILSKNRKSSYTDWMKHRVDSALGKQIYSHRMSVVEPVFGNLTINKHLTRFTLRGLEKIKAQWRLFCLIQNIEKLANYGQLT